MCLLRLQMLLLNDFQFGYQISSWGAFGKGGFCPGIVVRRYMSGDGVSWNFLEVLEK